jgi:hypothetical protein
LCGSSGSRDADSGRAWSGKTSVFAERKTIHEIPRSLKVSRKEIRMPTTKFASVRRRSASVETFVWRLYQPPENHNKRSVFEQLTAC